MTMGKCFKEMIPAVAVSILLLLCGCSASPYSNSERSLQELVTHISIRAGGAFTGRVFPVPVKAAEGMAMLVEGREIFLYKYDVKLKKQMAKLKQVRRSKTLYINGQKFDAEVNGCFAMIGHATNVKKKELIAAFKSF